MNKLPHDIKDDEIRIITSESNADSSLKSNRTKRLLYVLISIALAIICFVTIYYIVSDKLSDDDSDKLELVTNEVVTNEVVPTEVPTEDVEENVTETPNDSIVSEYVESGFVSLSDTIINKATLTIFKPVNLTPTLYIGTDVLSDSTVRFVVQAADIRGDNGGIVGAYVYKGELVSKGQAKSGFCAIIGGKINIGVADATPFLEQTLETDGYFFRQYPLVVANQLVENKPKGKSLRKALAELNGEPVVIMSHNEMTFHDFSQSLVDLGVTNAIYLVGGKGYGFAIDEEDRKIEFGRRLKQMRPNTNYIVWR